MAKATFVPASKPEGTVTVTLTESDARAFCDPSKTMTYHERSRAYNRVRDETRSAILNALRRG